jgi:hypothetical protein
LSEGRELLLAERRRAVDGASDESVHDQPQYLLATEPLLMEAFA